MDRNLKITLEYLDILYSQFFDGEISKYNFVSKFFLLIKDTFHLT